MTITDDISGGLGVFETAMDSMGLTPRVQQSHLVSHIRRAARADEVRFVQAGTGTGKSFAILTTALELARANREEARRNVLIDGISAAGEIAVPTLVVCPTNNLIDQYVNKDAPRVAEATGGTFYHVKGRSNYLCSDSFGMSTSGLDPHEEWNRLTNNGQGELEWANLGLDSSFGCSGDCDRDIDLCGIHVARARAHQADVVITNGHVLIYDWIVRMLTGGQVALLPKYGHLLVDECHTLDGIARDCLSTEIGPRAKILDLMPDLAKWAVAAAQPLTERNRELGVDPAEDLALRMIYLEAKAEAGKARFAAMNAKQKGHTSDYKEQRRLAAAYQKAVDFAEQPDPEDEGSNNPPTHISTVSINQNKDGEWDIYLNRRCVDASQIGPAILERQPSILVSGTIPPSLPRRLGVPKATLHDVGTPFDYSKCTLAISRHRGNDPKANFARMQETLAAVRDMANRDPQVDGGGTLILFTSWKDLNDVMPYIAKNVTVPVFAQTSNRKELAEDIEAFKRAGNAVLGGVQSLWTGLDIPGNALRQVIIYRLPWAVPDLTWAAIERVHGRQPYNDNMMQLLTQGIGRLVRSPADSGRVYIADSRASQINWRTNPMSKHVADFTAHRRG